MSEYKTVNAAPHNQDRVILLMDVNRDEVGRFFLPIEYAYEVRDENDIVLCATKSRSDGERVQEALEFYDRYKSIFDLAKKRVEEILGVQEDQQ